MMSRILAIDYGKNKIGLAISDPMRIIAKPLTTITGNNLRAVVKMVSQYNIEEIVYGLAVNADGSMSVSAVETKKYIEKLQSKLPNVKFVAWNEIYSTSEAKKILRQNRKKKERQKQNDDAVAAAVILQEYLDSLQ